MASKKYYDGSKWLQNSGNYLEIIEHLGGNDFKVKFENSPVFQAQAKEIKGGCVNNKSHPSLSGVGFIGYGNHPTKVGGKHTDTYHTWSDMIRRCYDSNRKSFERYGADGVTVCEEWKNFQNYAAWYEDNVVVGWAVDKDLIDYKPKIYSPETCSFLPVTINSLFTGGFKTIVCKKRNGYTVQLQKGEKCNNGNKRQSYFGNYPCKDQALDVYFTEKMKHITEVVARTEGNIHPKVLDNILNRSWVEEYIYYLSEQTNRRNK